MSRPYQTLPETPHLTGTPAAIDWRQIAAFDEVGSQAVRKMPPTSVMRFLTLKDGQLPDTQSGIAICESLTVHVNDRVSLTVPSDTVTLTVKACERIEKSPDAD